MMSLYCILIGKNVGAFIGSLPDPPSAYLAEMLWGGWGEGGGGVWLARLVYWLASVYKSLNYWHIP